MLRLRRTGYDKLGGYIKTPVDGRIGGWYGALAMEGYGTLRYVTFSPGQWVGGRHCNVK